MRETRTVCQDPIVIGEWDLKNKIIKLSFSLKNNKPWRNTVYIHSIGNIILVKKNGKPLNLLCNWFLEFESHFLQFTLVRFNKFNLSAVFIKRKVKTNQIKIPNRSNSVSSIEGKLDESSGQKYCNEVVVVAILIGQAKTLLIQHNFLVDIFWNYFD